VSAILRPYQIDITAEFERHVERGDRSILLVAPTGSGKTVIASAIIAGTARRVLMVAHRREIVNQTSDKLTARGVAHGIIQAGDDKKLSPAGSCASRLDPDAARARDPVEHHAHAAR
jgi:superfamily II DNA or RNA helicase